MEPWPDGIRDIGDTVLRAKNEMNKNLERDCGMESVALFRAKDVSFGRVPRALPWEYQKNCKGNFVL